MAQPFSLKYRPQSFEDLVSSGPTVRIIQNSILKNDILHGYLFSGSRGLGKTSIARIFAKALICLVLDKEKGEPCNTCENCREVALSKAPDVIEIDAASENSVSSIRELSGSLRFAPVKAKYKIIILDEVHMLSNAASNALLKILEEPPEYVVFIFCTTDPEKVIETVRSRCLNFTFIRLTINQIVERLKYICDQEKIKHTDESLSLIAASVNGGMRDAVTLLQQVSILAAEAPVTESLVNEIIGSVGFEKYSELFAAVVNSDLDKINSWFGHILSERSEISVLSNMINFLASVYYIKSGTKSLDFVSHELQTITKQVFSQISLSTVARVIEAMKKTISEIRLLGRVDTSAIIRFNFISSALGKVEKEAVTTAASLTKPILKKEEAKLEEKPSFSSDLESAFDL